jgi:hypothetical protein
VARLEREVEALGEPSSSSRSSTRGGAPRRADGKRDAPIAGWKVVVVTLMVVGALLLATAIQC